ALGKAMRTYNAQILPPGGAAQPGVPTFPSSEERARAALKEFREIVERYSFTRSAEIARYMAGVVAIDLGDAATAERELKAVAGSHNKDLGPLAKLALASLYRTQNREVDAVKLYRELIDQPTRTVPKVMAQLELASTYEPRQPEEAAKLYEQIRTENPASPAAEIANARLSSAQR
ncbi:MAG: tetratricopeptide repeat protein, partial [Terriglobales bacterium]